MSTVFEAVRAAQLPLLTVMLLAAGTAKLSPRARAVHGPAGLMPVPWRRPAVIATAVLEIAVALALIVLSGPYAVVARLVAAILFATAAVALVELRLRLPDEGCGCFGELSGAPVGRRSIARAFVFASAAALTLGEPASGFEATLGLGWSGLGVIALEVAALAALSPELRPALVGLGYRPPCDLREVPLGRTMATLRASAEWRALARRITEPEPVDVWRELCWRYVAYPGAARGRPVMVVFAVSLEGRHPEVRATVVDASTGSVLREPPVSVSAPG
ncbi:MAG: hypothetical protein GEV11_14615 [Streptosporangiales bacterium]|nr:hypothetical protein [Streptosporangiales bacterium]